MNILYLNHFLRRTRLMCRSTLPATFSSPDTGLAQFTLLHAPSRFTCYHTTWTTWKGNVPLSCSSLDVRSVNLSFLRTHSSCDPITRCKGVFFLLVPVSAILDQLPDLRYNYRSFERWLCVIRKQNMLFSCLFISKFAMFTFCCLCQDLYQKHKYERFAIKSFDAQPSLCIKLIRVFKIVKFDSLNSFCL